jgi:hypothetical protein
MMLAMIRTRCATSPRARQRLRGKGAKLQLGDATVAGERGGVMGRSLVAVVTAAGCLAPMKTRGLLGIVALGVSMCPLSGRAVVLDDTTNFEVKKVWDAPGTLGVPENLGGLLFSQDGATLYAVGSSEDPASALYAIPVTRDPATNQVTELGPMGAVTKVFDGDSGTPGSGLTAGLEFGPGGTFFSTYWSKNVLAERPGGVNGVETQFDMGALGIPAATTGLTFSPHTIDPDTGFGILQITANAPQIYNVPLTPAGGGIYTPGAVVLFVTLVRDDVGAFQYVPAGSFAGDVMYVSWSAGEIRLLDVDPTTGLPVDAGTMVPTLGTGNPVDQRFAYDLGNGPWGLTFDPLTSELFVGTWQGSPMNSIIQIGGPGFVDSGTPLAGKKLLLKGKTDDPQKRALKLVAKDPDVGTGAENRGPGDPTVHGGSLTVFSASGGFDKTYDLPALNWHLKGKPGKNKGYKLKSADPIKTVLVKLGKSLKVVAKGEALAHTLDADPNPVHVELRLGAQVYCLTFGGQTKFKAGKMYMAKKAKAPDACPTGATSTTSTTVPTPSSSAKFPRRPG